MLVTILLLIIIPIVDVFFVVFFMKRWLNKRFQQEKQQITERIVQFVTPADDKTPSEMQEWIKEYAPTIANCLYHSLVASFNQAKGALQRNFNSQQEQSIEAALPPIASIIMTMMPKNMKKSLLNNPGILDAAAGLMSGGSAGGQPPAGGSSGNGKTNFNKFE